MVGFHPAKSAAASAEIKIEQSGMWNREAVQESPKMLDVAPAERHHSDKGWIKDHLLGLRKARQNYPFLNPPQQE